MANESPGYPATLVIDYPDRDLNRVTSLLRPLTAVPIAIVLALVTGPGVDARSTHWAIGSGGILFGATALMIVFRRKYPRWWFDWNLGLTRFGTRVAAYLALMRDEYPSTDEEQAVHLEVRYPDAARELNRWLPLVKWILAIPHYVVLGFVAVAAVFCVLAAWIVILFTARYPRALFDFVAGALRWWLRVAAYAFLLTTDRYPPFSMAP
jgi:hypothetical protein